MQPITQMKQTPSFEGFEDGVLRINAFFDLHPWLPIGLLIAIVAVGIWRRWKKKE